ncbi:MAG: TonB-dependent receptor [Steroidobacteraceae bacterium]
MKNGNWRSGLSLAVVAALYGTGPAHAQADSGAGLAALDEVIVTARKRAESALEIPETIGSLSEETLERAGVTGLEDVGQLVTNLNLSVRTDGFPNVSVRGVGSFGNTQGVGFYIDDVQVFSDASARFGDLERIEVLKGPQGTLYGGSNIGGAVRFITARPDPSTLSGHARLVGGDQGIFEAEASLNAPLGDGGWAMRLFGMTGSNDGYLSNPNSVRANGERNTNPRDIGKVDQEAARISVAGPISDRLNLYAAVRWNTLDGPNNPWSLELDPQFEFPDQIDMSINPRHDRETMAATLELAYDADAFRMTSVTAYTDTESRRQSDLDNSQEWILGLFRPQDIKVFSQELRATSSGSGPLEWLAGLYYIDYEDDLDSDLIFYGGASLFEGIIPDPATEKDIIELAPFEDRLRNRKQQAAFFTASYRTGDLEWGGGVRIDKWEVETTNRQSQLSGRQSETEFLPRLSLTYFLDDSGNNVYATISRGFEPGGFNLGNFAGSNELFGFAAEEATNFELGFKGRFLDNSLTFTAAAFLIKYESRQFELQAADPVTGDFVEGIVNAGDSTQYGLEFDLGWQMSEAWRLSIGAGYVDAEWDSGTILADGTNLSGLTPPYVKDLTAVIAADYDRELASGLRMFARGQLSYNGSFEVDLGNSVENPDFTVASIRVGIGSDRWEFSAGVENLFDEEYYTDATLFPNFNPLVPQDAIIIGTLGQPRLLTAAFKVMF